MKVLNRFIKYTGLLFMPAVAFEASADCTIDYELSLTGGDGSGSFAPYYISSLTHGRFSQTSNMQIECGAWHKLDRSKKFSYGFGMRFIGAYASASDYERYSAESGEWYAHSVRPSSAWVQELFGELKYRAVFIQAGMKEHDSALLNQRLSSGDLVESGNIRPMPQMRAGFIDFQDIPFTRGWLQISGEVGYGMMLDGGWWKEHFNYYNGHIAQKQLYNYKRAYFRTKPSKPLSVTFGMQAAATFGGSTTFYVDGKETLHEKHEANLKYLIKMLFPMQDGGEGFYSGNHLGSWDIRARYRLSSGDELTAYTSWLWDDGSGIGKLNGWDGLWGLEYKASHRGIVNGAVVEYLDFTNQSGPIHYAPGDYDNSTLPGHASGADDYYNNASYNPYAYFGKSIGTPAIMAPIYNLDGYPAYVANAMRGFHVGVEGSLSRYLDYRVKGGYRKSWGTAKTMLVRPIHLTSVMLEASWRPKRVKGLTVNAKIEIDRGDMPCNAFGAMVGVRYRGLFKL